jgi:2,5-diamino-6-(ribosylamino)-4(3H)-pyrimidinone 5'-phosphate reductase
MLPKVIVHNAISLDGSIKGFEIDLGIYYGILSAYKPEAILVGSNTIIEASDEIAPEEESDFLKPDISHGDKRPYWVIADTRGVLKGLLHYYRKMEYVKDIIILVSEKTPASYLEYLKRGTFSILLPEKTMQIIAKPLKFSMRNIGSGQL